MAVVVVRRKRWKMDGGMKCERGYREGHEERIVGQVKWIEEDADTQTYDECKEMSVCGNRGREKSHKSGCIQSMKTEER